ncbi:MAG: restriction endonuclease subunit S, partial [Bacteroidales bacterium]|nr:restriction endonuclease subunit S [Bacteroidales bacterium]
MDTKKLRQKILDLAIHGKLVPQDPKDEPASVLLERIRAEKETLIKEGKIKRAKNTTASDTPHYENVPVGWCSTTIGEVFSLQAGKNISANDIHEYSPMFPYACYGGNGIRGYVDIYNKEGQFPIIGRQGALCGNVNFATGKFYATEHAVVVTCFAGVNVDWARLVLEAMNLNQYATATAQPGLSVATVVEVNLLLPPLEEQKRIADFVLQYLNIIECMGAEANDLMQGLKNAKSKILDLAIHGKLVTQDPTEEPASELLKRINPNAVVSCDNPHYTDLPRGWVML